MRGALGSRGISLIEVMIAVSLSGFALFAVFSLMGTAYRQQMHTLKSASAQLNAVVAFKAIEREMGEASYLLSPVVPGRPSDILTACANAQPAPGGGPLVPIDTARPMRFFAFCQNNGTFYHHTLPGCPASYSCGVNPASAVGGSGRRVTASFIRAPRGTVVRAALASSAGASSASRESSFAVAVAAGMNP